MRHHLCESVESFLISSICRPSLAILFHMKLYLNMKLFSNFLPRNDSMPFIPQNRGSVLTRQPFKSWEYSSLFVYGEMTSISHRHSLHRTIHQRLSTKVGRHSKFWHFERLTR